MTTKFLFFSWFSIEFCSKILTIHLHYSYNYLYSFNNFLSDILTTDHYFYLLFNDQHTCQNLIKQFLHKYCKSWWLNYQISLIFTFDSLHVSTRTPIFAKSWLWKILLWEEPICNHFSLQVYIGFQVQISNEIINILNNKLAMSIYMLNKLWKYWHLPTFCTCFNYYSEWKFWHIIINSIHVITYKYI